MSKNHTEDKMIYANDSVVALDQAAFSAPTAMLRSGLPNSAGKFLREKTGRVAFLGGSITQMNGWSKLIEENLLARFPETEFQFNNAGIGGTNSTFGVFRFDDDVLAKGPVDLLFIEFAVNDASDYGLANQRMQAMEGIIRKARQENPATDGAFTEMDLFDNYCHRFHRPVFHMLAHGLSNGPHTAQLRVADRQNPLSTGHAVRVLQFGTSSHQQ